MKIIFFYFVFFISSVFLQAQNTIDVSMVGFNSNEGTARVGLFTNEETFLRTPDFFQNSKIVNKKASVTFKDIPDGVYAISVYHDEDNNGKLNLIMGILPSEDTGTSNNPSVKLGPPKWEESKFEIKNGEVKNFEITIQ